MLFCYPPVHPEVDGVRTPALSLSALPMTFRAAYLQPSVSLLPVLRQAVFDVQAQPLHISPFPAVEESQYARLQYSIAASAPVFNTQRIVVSVAAAKVQANSVRWYEYDVPASATPCNLNGARRATERNRNDPDRMSLGGRCYAPPPPETVLPENLSGSPLLANLPVLEVVRVVFSS